MHAVLTSRGRSRPTRACENCGTRVPITYLCDGRCIVCPPREQHVTLGDIFMELMRWWA